MCVCVYIYIYIIFFFFLFYTLTKHWSFKDIQTRGTISNILTGRISKIALMHSQSTAIASPRWNTFQNENFEYLDYLFRYILYKQNYIRLNRLINFNTKSFNIRLSKIARNSSSFSSKSKRKLRRKKRKNKNRSEHPFKFHTFYLVPTTLLPYKKGFLILFL